MVRLFADCVVDTQNNQLSSHRIFSVKTKRNSTNIADFHIAYLIYVHWNLRVFHTTDRTFHYEASGIKACSTPPTTIGVQVRIRKSLSCNLCCFVLIPSWGMIRLPGDSSHSSSSLDALTSNSLNFIFVALIGLHRKHMYTSNE